LKQWNGRKNHFNSRFDDEPYMFVCDPFWRNNTTTDPPK